jgi:hypothetical protein
VRTQATITPEEQATLGVERVPTPPRSPRTSRRDLALWTAIGVTAIAVAVAVIVALVVASHSDKHAAAPSTVTTDPAQSSLVNVATIPTTAAPTTTLKTTTTLQKLSTAHRATIAQLATVMDDSEGGRADLSQIINDGIFANCRISAQEGATRLDGVIANRQEIETGIDAFSAIADPADRPLISLLRTAVDLSFRSDVLYQRWLRENAADPGAPCDRQTETFTSADALAQQAGDAKNAFLKKYNPEAKRIGLRSNWTAEEF